MRFRVFSVDVWTLLAWGVAVFLCVGAAVLVSLDWEDGRQGPFQDHVVDIRGVSVTGYASGKRRFHVVADRVWSGASKSIFSLESINNGVLYDASGRVVLGNLKADGVRVNVRTQVLSGNGHLSASLFRKALIPTSDEHAEARPVLIRAGALTFFAPQNRVFMGGAVEIREGDRVIRPVDRVEFDVSTNVAVMPLGGVFESPEFKVSGKRVTLLLQDRVALFEGEVSGIRRPVGKVSGRAKSVLGKVTRFRADQVRFASLPDGEFGVELQGGVRLSQSDKEASGDRASYRCKQRSFALSGSVLFKSSELSWMLDRSRKMSFENRDMAEAFLQVTTVRCQRLAFDGDRHEVVLEGGVLIEQPVRRVMCQSVVYRDVSGDLVLSGGVLVMKQERDSLRARELLVNVLHESVSAQNGVDTEFFVK